MRFFKRMQEKKHLRQWLITLLILLTSGITGVSGVAAQADDTVQLTVIAPALNVRSGPGDTWFIIGRLQPGDTATVNGQNSATGWLQVRLSNGLVGWINGSPSYVNLNGNTSNIPEIAAPVLPDWMRTLSAATIANSPAPPAELSGTIVFQTVSGGPIYTVNADGSGLRYLTTGIDPALSPDGSRVAFTRWEGVQDGVFGNVWIIDTDSGNEYTILDDVRQPKSPTWSPEGTQITISMQQGGWLEPKDVCGHEKPPEKAYDIERFPGGLICYTLPPNPYWGLRVVDVATGAFEDLPRDDHAISPTWDPANAWQVVYDGDKSLMGMDITRDTTWAIANDIADHSPVFSPDGSKIAVSYRQDNHWEIHTINPDGSERTRLTETPLSATIAQRIAGEDVTLWNNTAPAWSPDGASIAFLTDRTGAWEIWVMNSDGSNQRPLFAAGTSADLTFTYHDMDERVLSWQ